MAQNELDVQQLPFGIEALVEQASRTGEVILTRYGQPVARITPVIPRADLKLRIPTFGSAKGLVSVPDDFDAPLEEMSQSSTWKRG